MVITDDLGYARRRDPVSGLIQPWYTHGALDIVQGWDVSGKTVLEWGGGHSTLWWESRAARVITVENNQDYVDWIRSRVDATKTTVLFREWADVEQDPVPDGCVPDIAVIDGVARDECLIAALLLPRPLTVIFDNWQQDQIYLSPEAEALMAPYPGSFHIQADHTDHSGRPWQTAIWQLDAVDSPEVIAERVRILASNPCFGAKMRNRP